MLTKCLTSNELRTTWRKCGIESIVEKLERNIVLTALDIFNTRNRRIVRREFDAGGAEAMDLISDQVNDGVGFLSLQHAFWLNSASQIVTNWGHTDGPTVFRPWTCLHELYGVQDARAGSSEAVRQRKQWSNSMKREESGFEVHSVSTEDRELYRVSSIYSGIPIVRHFKRKSSGSSITSGRQHSMLN